MLVRLSSVPSGGRNKGSKWDEVLKSIRENPGMAERLLLDSEKRAEGAVRGVVAIGKRRGMTVSSRQRGCEVWVWVKEAKG